LRRVNDDQALAFFLTPVEVVIDGVAHMFGLMAIDAAEGIVK